MTTIHDSEITMAGAGLYLIVVHFGLIGGAAGPLPYDMQECRHRAAEMIEKRDAAWRDPEKARKFVEMDARSTPTSMRFVCTELPERPPLKQKWEGSVEEIRPEVREAPACEAETPCPQ